ncbi:hypothetical protein T439DRAFT_351732 [Meredithblackwellia eburnea MCA 4105]
MTKRTPEWRRQEYKQRLRQWKDLELTLLEHQIKFDHSPQGRAKEADLKKQIEGIKKQNKGTRRRNTKEVFPGDGDDENTWSGLNDEEKALARRQVQRRRELEQEFIEQKYQKLRKRQRSKKVAIPDKNKNSNSSSPKQEKQGDEENASQRELEESISGEDRKRNIALTFDFFPKLVPSPSMLVPYIPENFKYDPDAQHAFLPETPIKLRLRDDGYWWLCEGVKFAHDHGYETDFFTKKGIFMSDEDFFALNGIVLHTIGNLARYKAARWRQHNRMLQVIRALE